MRALCLWTSCILFAALAQAQAAPLPYALLTNAEILAKVDDATASELRFIMNASYFADGGVGFSGEEPRAATAFQRLMYAKDLPTFKLLCQAENGTAAMYGLKGLEKLAPAALVPYMPKLARRRGNVEAMSSCIGENTSLAAEAMELARRPAVSAACKRACVEAWLEAVRDQGAQPSDQSCAETCTHLVSNPFSSTRSSLRAACRYAELLLAEDVEALLTLSVVDLDEKAEFRELCTDALTFMLAAQRQTDWLESTGLEFARSRGEAGGGWAVAVYARFVQLYVTRRRFSGLESRRLENWKSRWSELKRADWRYLLSHRNRLIREAAHYLNTCPVSAPDDEISPSDAPRRSLWLARRITRAMLSDAPETDRFRKALLLIKEWHTDFPFWYQRGEASTLVVPTALRNVPPECSPEFVACLDALSASKNPSLRALAFSWLADESDEELLWNRMHYQPGFSTVLNRLAEDCESEITWQARSAYVQIAYHSRGASRTDQFYTHLRAWTVESARKLVGNPRSLIECSSLLTISAGRENDLVYGIIYGRCHFLPDEEWDSRTETETNSPQEIFSRMQAALAKLD